MFRALAALIVAANAFDRKFFVNYRCKEFREMEPYFGLKIYDDRKVKQCRGAPEAVLLKFCSGKTGQYLHSPEYWFPFDVKGYNLWERCTSGELMRYLPFAVFDKRGRFDKEGGSAISWNCTHNGVWVFNQWCEEGFGFHFIGENAARKYYEVLEIDISSQSKLN